jgi:hypothetical protein
MAESMLCTQCGSVTSPRRVMPGSILITVVLICFFVVPGIVYWLWRHTSTYLVCGKCGSRSIVPPDSPYGRDAIATRPAVAASLDEAKKGENDMFVGGLVLAGIVLVIVLLMWLSSR